MASRKKSETKKANLFLDSRSSQITGVILLFVTACLFISFFSYLFTWKEDQDKVLRFSLELLILSEHEVYNWLGRMGAILSNMFFYWGFGISSFGILYFLFKTGGILLFQGNKETILPLFKKTFFTILGLSILFGFIFQHAEFSWGGLIGRSIALYLTNLLGIAGVVIFLITLVLIASIWFLNPDLSEMSFDQLIREVKMRGMSLFSFRYRNIKKTEVLRSNANQDTKPQEVETLRPKKEHKKTPVHETDSKLSPPKSTESVKSGEQLAFEVTQRKPTKKADVDLGAELEVEIAAPEEITGDDKALSSASPLANEHPAINEDDDPNAPFDPTKDLSQYEYPHLSLLNEYADQKIEIDREELESYKEQIITTLLNYKIEITKIKATVGPTVTLYEIVPAPGVRISKIKNLEDDIALSLAALGIRIIAPIPGKGTIGIEVPNKKKQIVSLREVLRSEKFQNGTMDIPIALGKTIQNEVFIADLSKMPHLLIAGATGQGKSVGINSILMSMLYKKHPSQLKLVLIDPKKVELYPFTQLENHFLAALESYEDLIITDTNQVVNVLISLTMEMDQRYDLLKNAHARNIKEYNEKFIKRKLNPNKGHQYLPYIVLVIDEFADLIMTAGKEVELPVARLAQLARAVGIHLIIATQRPSVNIITGTIKANFPARIAFKVSSKVDSRTILDTGGADRLIGRGDMLLSLGGEVIRLQCAFVDTPEVEAVLQHIHGQQGYMEPHYLPEFEEADVNGGAGGQMKPEDLDANFADGARLIVSNQHGSTSMLQRRLKLGYNRAGRIMDQLEAFGVVGPNEGSKPREVLFHDELELERFLETLNLRK